MRALLSSFLVIVSLLFPSLVTAATKYVSPTGTSTWANATNAGSPASLATANANVAAGDLVWVLPGTYATAIQPNANGTSGNRIRYYATDTNPANTTVTNIRFGWNGSNSRGDYATARGFTVSGAMTGCDETAGLYATGDSIANCRIPNAAGGTNFRTKGSTIDNCVFSGGSITGTGQSHFVDMFNANNVFATNNRFTNNVVTLTVNTTASQGDVHVLGLARTHSNVFYGNTFNVTVTACFGYFFPIEQYRSYYNSFQNNRFNLTMNATPGGTHALYAFRDSSSYNRLVDNQFIVTGSGAIGTGWSQSGSFSGTTNHNYAGGNYIKVETPATGVFFAQNGCRQDTLEFNHFITAAAIPAFQIGAVDATGLVVRHNTFYSGSANVISMASATNTTGTKFVSNIAYSTVANGAGTSATALFPSGVGLDSAGVYFARGGTAANAIRYNGTNGAPASGANYGIANKAVWNTPRFTDSTFAAFNSTLLSGSPAEDNNLHDGFAGALGEAIAPPSDVTPPTAIAGLAAFSNGVSSVSLSWESSGDDGTQGSATSYVIKRSTSPINSGNFDAATTVSGAPTPQLSAGEQESMLDTGLSPNTVYWYAIKVGDEVPNYSTISNLAAATTDPAPDTTPPATTSTLATGAVTTTTIALSWTAPGDDGTSGTATSYDLRRSTSPITAANWASATTMSGEPTPSVAGTTETYSATGLTANTLYYFGLKTTDDLGNVSALSNVPSGTTSSAAVNAITVGPDTVTVQFHSASLRVGFTGDANSNATAKLKYGLNTQYSDSAVTVERINQNRFAAVFFWLQPGETYYYQLIVTDTDGGSVTHTGSFTTRSLGYLPAIRDRQIFVGPAGNDLNPGTSDLPLATLGAAHAAVGVGGQIRLLAGTYHDTLVVTRRAISIVGEPGAVLDGGTTSPITWTSLGSGGIYFVRGLPEPKVVSWGPRYTLYHPARRDTFASTFWPSFYYNGDSLLIKLGGTNPNGQSLHVPDLGIAFRIAADSVRIDSLTIRYYGTSYGQGAILAPLGGDANYCKFTNLFCHGIGGNAITDNEGADGNWISNCTVNDSTIYRFGFLAVKSKPQEYGAIAVYGRNTTVSGNRVSGLFNGYGVGASGGIDDEGPGTDLAMYLNTADSLSDDAFELDLGHGICARVYQNTARKTNNCFSAAPCYTGPMYFLYNIGASFSEGGIKLGDGGASPSVGLIRLYHNTFVSTVTNGKPFNGAGGSYSNVTATNNIFAAASGKAIFDNTAVSGFSINFNTLNSNTTPKISWQGTNHNSWNSFKLVTGFQTNPDTAAVVFADSANGNFRLDAAASAKNKGRRIPGINTVSTAIVRRKLYSSTAPDNGAYESSTAATNRKRGWLWWLFHPER